MPLATSVAVLWVALLFSVDADVTSEPSRDCAGSCPATSVVDPVLLQLGSSPRRHGGPPHASLLNETSVKTSLQPCPAARSQDRQKIVKDGKRLIREMGYCPTWEQLKTDYRRKAFLGGLKYSESVIQEWSALRDPMLRLGFECAKQITNDAEYELYVPPASTSDPTSDIDATCSGKNPTSHISNTLIFMDDVLTKDLGCAPYGDSAENVVAWYFDTNIYGNLVSLDMKTYEEMKWPPATQALFQQGVEEKSGRTVMYLKRVCDQTIMDQEIDTRINFFLQQINSGGCDEHPVHVVINQQEYETDLNKFWTALQLGNKYTNTDQSWMQLFRDLGSIMANQRESYLTYAGTFDVVMDRASGLKLSMADQASKQCIDHVASRDSICFLLEHIYHDGVGLKDRTRMRFLVETSKYWDRLYDSVFPNPACVALRKGSAAIKKCGPCLQNNGKLKCGLKDGASSTQVMCPNTVVQEGSCVMTAFDEQRSCKTYRAIGREVTMDDPTYNLNKPAIPNTLLQYLEQFDQCVGYSELKGMTTMATPKSPPGVLTCDADWQFRQNLFNRLRMFGTR